MLFSCHNDIIVFDEAQRAWDTDRREPDQTEATILLRIGDRIAREHGKVTIVCLIGDGQAIHVHEETGMYIWLVRLLDAMIGMYTFQKDMMIYSTVHHAVIHYLNLCWIHQFEMILLMLVRGWRPSLTLILIKQRIYIRRC